MTEAKRDIIKASKSQIEDVILKHLDEFKQGVPCTSALQFKPENIKQQFFEIGIKTYCDRKKIQKLSIRQWCYELKQEYYAQFDLLKDEMDQDDDIQYLMDEESQPLDANDSINDSINEQINV
ncbi:MAG: hypothetical protein EZS28_029312 [Streblomastix strix]|uniref:Uncharacterized protein n=1 Tax=Streblomastix strix TaxID=222440 RepID=A0A5J4UZ70_9EUKA|nr:MAG: hypothetical protein EZS28_029312 [Streblomastix strix]